MDPADIMFRPNDAIEIRMRKVSRGMTRIEERLTAFEHTLTQYRQAQDDNQEAVSNLYASTLFPSYYKLIETHTHLVRLLTSLNHTEDARLDDFRTRLNSSKERLEDLKPQELTSRTPSNMLAKPHTGGAGSSRSQSRSQLDHPLCRSALFSVQTAEYTYQSVLQQTADLHQSLPPAKSLMQSLDAESGYIPHPSTSLEGHASQNLTALPYPERTERPQASYGSALPPLPPPGFSTHLDVSPAGPDTACPPIWNGQHGLSNRSARVTDNLFTTAASNDQLTNSLLNSPMSARLPFALRPQSLEREDVSKHKATFVREKAEHAV